MDPTLIPDPPGFSELSKADQIRYLQGLWDRIAVNPQDVSIPQSHLELVKERLADYRRDPRAARPARDLIAKLRSAKTP